jgi:hypothetical protein
MEIEQIIKILLENNIYIFGYFNKLTLTALHILCVFT